MIFRKTLAVLAIFLFSQLSFASKATIYRGIEANEIVKGAEIVRIKEFTFIPNYVKFKQGEEIPFAKLESFLNQFLEGKSSISLQLISEEEDNLGFVHYRYKQEFNGYPIRLSMYIVHVKNGMIHSMNGELFDNEFGFNSVQLAENDALEKALQNINASLYKWEIPEAEEHLKWEQEDLNATYFPKGELTYVNVDGKINNELRLAYKFNIYAQEPLSRQEVYVDAENGNILWTENKIHHVDELGTAQTAYSGLQNMTSDNMGGGNYRLQETGRGNGIRTFNCNETTNYTNTDFTNNSANWNLSGTDAHATDAHWGAEMTYDYYLLKHARNSINGSGFRLDSYVHYDQNYGNAFWDGQRMTYGDGSSGNSPFTALDIAGHEITHGLTTFTANLVYQDESGALNESFSDIFGVSVEFVARPGNSNWLMGEDLGFTIRNMSNPNSVGDPDTYFGNNWAALGGGDNGGVHTNSGVQNYWFYLLVDGGSGTNDNGDSYNITPLGLDDAGKIAFRNLTVYLTTNSEYADARFFSIQSTVDLFGPCTPEVEQVTNAWYAVGVGNAYVPYTVSDFDACLKTSCSVPFTVDFDNLSVNGSAFDWDFGDGSNSTTMNPSHTYTSYGTYTVELFVDGGATCGNDTKTEVAYITIDSTLDCTTIMPTSGNTVLTESSGTLFDSGGPCSLYGANQTSIVTISPVCAEKVYLDFIMFDVEEGSQPTSTNCDYDNMKIYDGPNTSSPIIGTYCNNNLPPSTIASTGSSITILFSSDPGLEESGFEIEWTSDIASIAPAVDFSVDIDTTCTGEVRFSDLSAFGPTTWNWDFGDGNTSTSQHPQHTYTSPGLYNVQLSASNCVGQTSEVKNNFIFVNMPDAPIVQGDSICTGNPANLTANGSGTIKWYDSPSSTSSISTGSNYTTPSLSSSTTYYVEDIIVAPLQSFGKPDNSGGGGYLDNEQYLVFDAYQEMFIQSVQVYAQTSGSRTVQLKDKFGTVLGQKTQSVSAGLRTMYLLFNVPPGTDYQLVLSGSSTTRDLYRNNSGVSYPYALSGVGAITNSSAGSDYYYYFYNWQVKGPDCTSERIPVTAEVNMCTGIQNFESNNEITSFYNSSNNSLNVLFNNVERGNYSINIYNSVGQLVYSEDVVLNQSEYKMMIETNSFSKGLYFVNISNSLKTVSNKFVK